MTINLGRKTQTILLGSTPSYLYFQIDVSQKNQERQIICPTTILELAITTHLSFLPKEPTKTTLHRTMKFHKNSISTFVTLMTTTSMSLTTTFKPSNGTNTTIGSVVYAMSSNPTPFREIQPNGLFIQLRIHGDEDDAWLSDLDGYTVVQDNVTGEYRYAQPDGQGGLECSHWMVGNDIVVPHDNDDDNDLMNNLSLKSNSKTSHMSQQQMTFLDEITQKSSMNRPKLHGSSSVHTDEMAVDV